MQDDICLFLSRFRIDAAAAVNPYEIHRMLWKAFPNMPEADRPYLFRIMPHKHGTREVLLQSTRRPVGTNDPRVVLLECREFVPVISAGQRLKFETSVNPVKRLAGSGDRVPLIHDEERVAWLARHLDSAELESCRITTCERLCFRKPGMRPGKIETVTISGVLRVKDPRRFLETCRSGVGPGKSFGCGLLLLARA